MVWRQQVAHKFKHPLEVRKYWREKQARYRVKKKAQNGG